MNRTSWKLFFADDIFKVASLLSFGPPIYALNQFKNHHSALGLGIFLAWIPAQAIFLWWLHKKDAASIWLTAPVVVVVLVAYAKIANIF